MLTPLDETLRHQLAMTFDHAGTSDPRFFDRYWFAVYDPQGREPLVNVGMSSYLNMNVVDGYATIIRADRQHNLRMSRALRPHLFDEDPQVNVLGPLRISIVEPLRRLRLELGENSHGMAFDLDWQAMLPPHEELPNFSRVRGRISQHYLRYNQSGRVNGWIEIDGARFDAADWWGGRDHSWGLRPDVAGPEPKTDDVEEHPRLRGFLWTWLTFGTDSLAGHVQLHENSDGTAVHSEALLEWPVDAGREAVNADVVDLVFDVYPGTRRFSTATYTFENPLRPGELWQVRAEPISRSLVMRGAGYSLGYEDGRGHGMYRGAYHEEYDVYDISHPEDVVLPDGTIDRPYHRDCAVRVVITAPDGSTVSGAGHCAIIPTGPLPKYGLE